LDLRHNKLVALSDDIHLPHLLRLDVSHNEMNSLDFLQHLTSLRFLDASYNHLSSLQFSIHVLVPLKHSLFSLDLVPNAVCDDLQYADTLIEILPHLNYLDGYNLKALSTRTSPLKQQHHSPSQHVKKPPVPKIFHSHRLNGNAVMASRIQRALKRQTRHDHSYTSPNKGYCSSDKENSKTPDVVQHSTQTSIDKVS
jgi:Leucine-rich repeat (LRR) protein